MKTKSTIFISASILGWEAIAESSSILDDSWRTPYSYQSHAENLSSKNEKHHLIDCIANLKRALDHRIKHLTLQYKLKETPAYKSTRSILRALVELQVIRPMMLKNIIDVRNAVEHQYASPPSPERCQELSEFTWYFLRSTDSLAQKINDGFVLKEIYESPYSVSYNASPENGWSQEISLRLPANLTFNEYTQDTFEVSLESYKSGDEHISWAKTIGGFAYDLASRFKPDDIIAKGKLTSTEDMAKFSKLYFECR